MNSNNFNNNRQNQEKSKKAQENKPNEKGNVAIQGNIKIFDPETKEVYVNVRT